ncbi:hypothetical protein K438DRAFT_1962370 [Mycena galopus ATCC 62051]|nr:hypothetical protein K438DRAFT_1962370 [Mycena galopus ATCC 62051]
MYAVSYADTGNESTTARRLVHPRQPSVPSLFAARAEVDAPPGCSSLVPSRRDTTCSAAPRPANAVDTPRALIRLRLEHPRAGVSTTRSGPDSTNSVSVLGDLLFELPDGSDSGSAMAAGSAALPRQRTLTLECPRSERRSGLRLARTPAP